MFSVNYERGNRLVKIVWEKDRPNELILSLYLNYFDNFYFVKEERVSYSGPVLSDSLSIVELDDDIRALLVSLSEHMFTEELPKELIEELTQ
ncbi:MAG: hypothetical protein K6G51_05570 [Sphaerochaetaceae bacterium]|nr:hypothetical protein [Sphaerochaetaceae bacterium]